MKIGEAYEGCRYWGYEPASAEFLHADIDREEKRKLRERFNEERKTIRTAGYRPVKMGMSKEEAIAEAKALESRFLDIEMRVFNHDYL